MNITKTEVKPLLGTFVNLRPLLVSDAELTLKWRRSQRAMHLNSSSGTVEQQAKWIQARPSNEFNFMIETKAARPLGMLSLISIDLAHQRGESARFLIGDEEGVKGIPAAVEAMLLLYQFAFDELKLERVYGTIGSANTLMIKWQKYLGMKEEGRLRKHYRLGGETQDAVCLGLLAEEYRRESLPRMRALISAGMKKV